MEEFAKRFFIDENIEITMNGETFSTIQQVMFRMAETWDDRFINEIIKEARVSGMTEVVVMNKRKIMDALTKQMPKVPIERQHGYVTGIYCTVCKKQQKNRSRSKETWHCERCGQKLFWGNQDGNETRKRKCPNHPWQLP
jgi:ribosomal protein L37AE/L43A